MKLLHVLLVASAMVITACGPTERSEHRANRSQTSGTATLPAEADQRTPATGRTATAVPTVGGAQPTASAQASALATQPAAGSSAETAAGSTPAAGAPTAVPQTLRPTSQTAPTAAASGEAITWQGLRITIPANGVWSTTMPPEPDAMYGAPVLAQGQIGCRATQASTPLNHCPGMNFSIVQFAGSVEAWYARVQQESSTTNPIEDGATRPVQVAGREALRYSHAVSGTGAEVHFIVPLDADRLLLIRNGDVYDRGYQVVMNGLSVEQP